MLPPTTGVPLNLFIPAFDYGINPGDETWDIPANANFVALNNFASSVVLFNPAGNQTVTQPASSFLNINFPLIYTAVNPTIRFGASANSWDSALTRTGAGAFTLDSNTIGNAAGTLKLGIANAVNGFQYNGAAPSGYVLIGNGTEYVGQPLLTALNYQTVQAAAVSKPAEPKLNFLAPFAVADNAGNASSDVSLASSGVTAGTYNHATITVAANGLITAAANATTAQFTLPGGTLSPEASTTYDTGIAISGTAVVVVSVLSGTISPILTYTAITTGGTIKLFVGNTSSSTISYGALTYNYAVIGS